ncbi:MAG TPA: tRNA (adenosine(37)-N6)-threonylcarbamoyltransferase complex transferase subunit TsaD [Phycisphaerales bacterium]|nr:tRNA (adenosine(37)-N6)-threonylcarbamoyltransferase complex transferase subunit TsaD [Phycisphaerales bacterium]
MSFLMPDPRCLVPASPLILALESSCDETAAAVVRAGNTVLSNVIASQHDLHAEYAGVVPEIASRAHVERLLPVLRRALTDANITYTDLAAIAVGHRPGLIGSLLVGVSAAKALAWSLNIPILGIDHVQAHLYAGLLDRAADSLDNVFPALGLVVSGGHTSLYLLDSPLKLRRLGSTIDDAVGEAYDKAAVILGLPFPGGPHLDKLAQSGNDRAFDFPLSRLAPDSLDFSFSGLKTATLYTVRGVPQAPSSAPSPSGRGQGEGYSPSVSSSPSSSPSFRSSVPRSALPPDRYPDVAASFQRAAINALLLKVRRALDLHSDIRSLLIGGGVSANSRLRTEFTTLARERNLRLFLPPMPYCLDNAAMIAGLAWHRFINNDFDDLALSAHPSSSLASA